MRFETTCEACGKRVFRDRAAARATAKQIPGRHMTAYSCPVVAHWWHLGHLPADVRQGLVDKAAYEARVAQRRQAS